MDLRRAIAATFLAITLSGQSAPAGEPPAKTIALRLQAVLDRAVADDPSVPGALVSVSAPLIGVEWSGASGLRDLHAPEKLLPDQPFRIASITKVFVAATIFRLIEERRLALYDPIALRLSPATVTVLKGGGYDPDRITIQQLLAHTSGIYDYASAPAFNEIVMRSPHKRWTPAEQIRFAVEHGNPVGRPGERYSYSDTGYVILGEIIGRATQQSLPRAIRTLLNLNALGLTSTYFESLEDVPRRAPPLAHQYFAGTDFAATDPSFDLYGGGGLVSTTADLNRFFRALLQGRLFKHRQTLAAALMTVDALHDPGEHLHANLLTTLPLGRRMCWGHRGFWGSETLYCPDTDLAVSFTLNQSETLDGGKLAALVHAIADELDRVPGL